MNKLAQNQEWELTVEFITKTVQRAFTRGKMVSKLSGNRWGYTGKTKSEAIFKAKQAGRYNASYAKEWAIIESN